MIFAGGGTGGHVMPGVATAEALGRMVPGSRSLFLSTERDAQMPYSDSVDRFPTAWVPAARCGGLSDLLRFAAVGTAALHRSAHIYRRFRPHVVVGLGGYSSAVPVLAARLMRVPVMLFESNAKAGRAVRLLSRHSQCVQTQWAGLDDRLDGSRVMTGGIPVRERMFRGSRPDAQTRFTLDPDRFTVLVMGGSQGALSLNRLVATALRNLPGRAEDMQVLHLTGTDHLSEAQKYPLPDELIYRPVG